MKTENIFEHFNSAFPVGGGTLVHLPSAETLPTSGGKTVMFGALGLDDRAVRT